MYSQNNEDQLIKHYFNGYSGTLMEIGANDGVTLSNSKLLLDNGWSGVLVEPNDKCLIKLHDLYDSRTDIQIIPFGVSDKCGTVDFYESGSHITKDDHSLISTIHQSELKRWKGSRFDNFTKSEIEVVDVPTLMELSIYDTFDFISIDTEGEDVTILKQLDLTDVHCICIEHNSNSVNRSEILRICHDYKILHENNENLILVK
jgi:FkbM family methyltransferase